MGVFAKYRKFYREPERISIENARLNRVASALKREQEAQIRFESLSPVTKSILSESRRLVKDNQIGGPKAASIAAALSRFKERDFSDPANRLAYRELRALQMRPQGSKVKAAASDKRQFNPTGKDYASTMFGTVARLSSIPRGFSASRALPGFRMSWSVVPCIERLIRREVLFAKGKGGRGYHVRKRRTWSSLIPC